MKHKSKNRMFYAILAAVIMAAFFCWYRSPREKEDNLKTVTIAVMEDHLVENFNTNYYTKWLEEQTGYKIVFEYISKGYETEYLNAMLGTATGRIDAVFLPADKQLLAEDMLKQYVDEGKICNLSQFMTKDCEYTKLLGQYQDISMQEKITYKDGLFYMPNMDTTRKEQNMQVLWINMGWLKALGLQIPQSTTDLETVLFAFRDNDPNGNGVADELPMICCNSSDELQCWNYLMNAFVYNDPLLSRRYIDENGKVQNAAITDSFREGLVFCNRLYEEGLLSDSCLFFTERQLMELVNAQENVVGAFTSQSISDVVYQDCTDILARFIQVPPLLGTDGEQNAVYVEPQIQIGGYIPANSIHQREAFEVMDFMLSEEASLIASFGEEGVDWNYSDSGDLSAYGTQAKITTLQYLKDTIQNKNFASAGPLVLSAAYADGVTWNGNNSLVEYIDARAVRAYESYYYEKRDILKEEAELSKTEMQKTDTWVLQYIFSEKDIDSDVEWEKYLKEP